MRIAIAIFGAGCAWTAGRLIWDWLRWHDQRSIEWAAINTAEGIVEDEWHNLLEQARRREEQRQQVLDYYGFSADPTARPSEKFTMFPEQDIT